MKKVFSIAFASLLVMSCASTSKEAADTLQGGVGTIAAYGHTPGHTVFQKDSILVIADLMHGAALQLKHPEYCPFFDMNPEEGRIEAYTRNNGNFILYSGGKKRQKQDFEKQI